MADVRHVPAAQGTPRRVPRLVLVVLAVVIGLALAVAVDVTRSGGPRAWLARHGLGAVAIVTYVSEGRRVDIGGRSLYIDCRGEGSPTVVLVGGMGSSAETWASVFGDLAATTRTCVYDRPGIGRSDAGTTPDHAAAAADLRALLDAAGERPPFVVVGHSLGADMARVMGSEDRERVVGVGLIDGFAPDLWDAAVLPHLGELGAAYKADQLGLWDLVNRTEGLDRERSLAQLAAIDLRGLPIEVVDAARAEPRLDEATNDEIRESVAAAYDALSPGLARITLAYGSGHMVQFDRPELVVEAVRRLVDAGRP
jgi:pimeloyl-ACP methyl ester carboxylesterase